MTYPKRKSEFKNVLNNEIDGFKSNESIGEGRKKAKLELEQWMNKSSNDEVSNIIKSNAIIRVYVEDQKYNIESRSNLKGLRSKLRTLGKVIHQFEHILEANGIKSTDLALFECKYIKYVLVIMRGYESCNTRYFAHKTFEKALDCYISMLEDDNGDTNKLLMNKLLKFKYLYGKGTGYINADYDVARTLQQTPTLSEDDLFKLYEYCDKQIMDYTEKIRKKESISFIKIRQLLFTKMTLLNCKKTEDLSTLKINEYIDSMNNIPVNQRGAEHPTAVSSLEQEYFFIIRFENTDPKLMLFSPFFMPRKYKTVLTYLIDPKVRKQNNINIKNEYVFPNSRNSLEHVEGNLDIKRVCQMSKLFINNITASSVRHFIHKKLSQDFSISSDDKCEIRELLGLNKMYINELSKISKMLDLDSSVDLRRNVSDNYKMFPCDESEKLMFYLHMKTYFKNLTEDDVPQILKKHGARLCDFVSDPLQTIPNWIVDMCIVTESFIIESLVRKEVYEKWSNSIKALFPDAASVDFKKIKDKTIFNILKQITKEMFAEFTKGKAISEDVQTVVLAELARLWQDDIPKEDQIENF